MHNSCASIQVAILIFHEAFKKNGISQYSAFFTLCVKESRESFVFARNLIRGLRNDVSQAETVGQISR